MASYEPVIKNGASGAIFYIGLPSATASATMQASATLAAGDVKISIDGGALTNLTTLPTVTPAAGKLVKVTLSQAETNGDSIAIVFSDQTSPKEWCDTILSFNTVVANFDSLSGRIPSALVGGRMDSNVGTFTAGAITTGAFTAGAIDANAIATDAIGSAELAASAVTEIAAGVWQDAVAGDFTVASSIGKALYVANFAPGAAGGHMISGSNAGTTTFGAFTVTGAATFSGGITANITGSLSGSVGSVTGAVGSVTGSVGSIAAGGIATTSFAAGAINAAAIATDAIGAAELAADAVTEIANAIWDMDATLHQTQGTFGQAIGDPVLDTDTIYGMATIINADTDNIQTRLPAALVGGKMDSNVGAFTAGAITSAAFAAGAIDASAIATDAIGAAEFSQAAADKVWATSVRTLTSSSDPSAATIASAVWDMDATAHQTQGTFGQAIGDPVADVHTIYGLCTTTQADTDDIQTRLPAALVGGRMDASVGAIAANAITAASIATNAIDADALASDAVTEIQAGLATSASIATLQADTDDIQARLPAALVSGKMLSHVSTMAPGSIDNTTFSAGAIDSTVLADDCIGSAELGASAITEIQAGLATSAAVAAVQSDTDDIQSRLPAALVSGRIDASVGAVGANVITAAALAADAVNEIADGILDRDMATGTDSGSTIVRTTRQALRFNRNRWEIGGGVLTVFKEDDVTTSWTAAVTTTAGNPVSASDPAGP